MYKLIVKHQVLRIFDQANQGNWQVMIDGLHDEFSYRFVGETPLGGIRKTRDGMSRWWQRLFRLFPELTFHPQTIVVQGFPWDTKVTTYVKIRALIPSISGNEMVPYENEFMQLMQLRWGKITSVLTLEDTKRFDAILPQLAAAGIVEATEPPIGD